MKTKEFFEGMTRLHAGFMTPKVEEWTATEAQEYTDDPEAEAGYYCRLSASGYLDCTDWSGPFETQREAEEHLVEMYDDEF